MSNGLKYSALLSLGFCAFLIWPAGVTSKHVGTFGGSKDKTRIARSMVLDGSPVHNVGQLHLHTGNWGAFGSMPGSSMPFSHAPSAEWPAGSGVEYLFVAGLWVGGIKSGVPCVSTAAFEIEFRPTTDPVDVVYYAAEGDPGGVRLPHAGADDDGDGEIDEEWLDGRDNDADGFIDEDYAAISEQMLSCWYTDDQPEATQIYPQHNPMHLLVKQRSFQWSDLQFDDFVAFDYTITNTDSVVLQDVYVGIFADGDAGSRSTPNYWEDDACAFSRVPGVCTAWGAASVDFAYWYDADGDGGLTTGQCGILLLDHTTDPTGTTAPPEVAFCTFRAFRGSQPYENGGDPTNDFERYECMSSEVIDAPVIPPRDIRILVNVGPFPLLGPGESIKFSIAIFAGTSPGGLPTVLRQNAAAAKLTHRGQRYDLDADPSTGVAGRETPVYGPATNVVVDSCVSPPVIIPSVPAGQTVWTNADCAREESEKSGCGFTDADSALYRTGIEGKEAQVHWVLPTDIYVPVLIAGFFAQTSRTAAVLSWEILADEAIQGFRIYRAAAGEPAAVLPSFSGLIPPESRSFTDGSVRPGRSYAYTLAAVLDNGSQIRSGTVEASIPARTTELHQNFPNPFNPATTISFTLVEKGPVNLSIFTPEGKRVVTLIDGILNAGNKEATWDGKDAEGSTMGSGVYFYRLRAGKTVLSRKMIYLK